MRTREIRENCRKLRDIPTKYPVSQLQVKLQVTNWYKIDAETLSLYTVALFALIFISINANENIGNKRKF